MMRRLLIFLLVCAALTTLAASTFAQETAVSGRGVVREGNVALAGALDSLNPLLCDTQACRRLTALMYPQLLAIDPELGIYTGADQSDQFPPALALGWSIDGDTYTLTLRDDLLWSDGTPVTAVDVLFSYLVSESDYYFTAYSSQFDDELTGNIHGADVIDSHTIRFTFIAPTCDALAALDFFLIPAHVHVPDFMTAAENLLAGDPDTFEDRLYEYALQGGFNIEHNPFTDPPMVTLAGAFGVDEVRVTEYIRLTTPDGQMAYEYVDVPDRNTEVDMFLRGELNFISNPPNDRRDDLRAAEGRGEIRIFEYPGMTWYAIAFNVADPDDPQPAFDEDGNPMEQGTHPIFSDVRVRRAVQLALDVPTMLEASIFDEGTVMAANQVPSSWAFNPDLQPVGYDPIEAERLLDEAGWYDANRDGVRECVRCTTAEPDARLSFDLVYPDSSSRYSIMANLISRDLLRIGMSVNAYSTSTDSLESTTRGQQWDAAIVTFVESFPANPDQANLFTREFDRFGTNGNIGSYVNEDVESLLNQARDVDESATCDLDARADLYRQAQEILQADQPYAWLFAVNQFMAVRADVANWDPEPFFPLWHIDEWVIAPVGGG